MTLDLTTLASAGLVLGLSSGLHCAAMCGPLAAGASRVSPRSRPVVPSIDLAALAGYQVARLGGYVAMGALAGALGASVASVLPSVASALTWVLAVGCGLLAVGVRVPGVSGWTTLVTRVARRVSGPRSRGLLLGALTPLLPCGLLLSTYSLAAVTAGPTRGAALVGGFAVGNALPLLGVQLGWTALGRHLSPVRALQARRGLWLLTALTLAWRGWSLAHGGLACHGL